MALGCTSYAKSKKMEAIKKFQQTIDVQCYSQSTKRAYIFHIKKFLAYYHNNLSQENIEKHLYYLRTYKNYSPESLNLARASLFYFFDKILKQPITIDIPKIKRKKSLPKPETRETIIKDGVDIRHIQVLMGHSSSKTTEIYTKVTQENLKKIRSPLDNIKLELTANMDVKGNKEVEIKVS